MHRATVLATALALTFRAGISAASGPTRDDLRGVDIFYSNASKWVYVLTTSASPHLPNSIVALDPLSGQDMDSVSLGGQADKMAPADDGIHVYVHLSDTGSIRRINLATHQTDLEFPGVIPYILWMAVAPGDPDTMIASFMQDDEESAAAYRLGSQLPATVESCGGFVFGATADTLWCVDTAVDASDIFKLQLDSAGLHVISSASGLAYGVDQVPSFWNGRLYFESLGAVIDPEAHTKVGFYP